MPKASSPPSAYRPEKELTIVGHLEELRMRLIICVAATVILTFASFFVARPLLEVLIRPVRTRPAFAPQPQPRDELVLLVAPDGTLRLQDPALLADPDRLADLTRGDRPPRLVLQPAPDATASLTAAEDQTTPSLTVAGGPRPDLIYTHPLDPFMMPLKVAIVLGILLSLVVWVWQIWLFVAPGLTEKEKRVVGPLLGGAIFLFPLGAGFAYLLFFLLIPVMQGYIVPGIETLYTIRDYLRLMTNMMIVFGFIFELPLVVALLARIGIVTPAFLRHYRRHIYVALAIVAMVITPADPFSMLIALIPLVALFELSILVSGVMTRMRDRDFEAESSQEGPA